MNPVNAAALYVSASRAVLQCDPRKPHTFSDMYTLLPFFRQSLACLVCGELVRDPVSAPHPGCPHHVCLGCRGQKMLSGRAACGRCRDVAGFQEDKQLSLLVRLYRKLCVYVAHSALLPCVSANAELMALLEEALLAPAEDAESPDGQDSCASMERTDDGEPVEDGVLLDVDPGDDDGDLELDTSTVESSTSTEELRVPADLYLEPGECNGALLESLEPSSPELEVCELMESPLPPPPTEGLSVSDTATLELSLTTGPFTAGAFAPGAFAPTPGGRELEEGEVLLLSVEEVLQTLDPLQPPSDGPQDRHAHMYLQLDAAHNYTQLHGDRTHMALSPAFPAAALAAPLPPLALLLVAVVAPQTQALAIGERPRAGEAAPHRLHPAGAPLAARSARRRRRALLRHAAARLFVSLQRGAAQAPPPPPPSSSSSPPQQGLAQARRAGGQEEGALGRQEQRAQQRAAAAAVRLPGAPPAGAAPLQEARGEERLQVRARHPEPLGAHLQGAALPLLLQPQGVPGLHLPRLPELVHGQRREEAGGVRRAREGAGADAADAGHQPHQHHGGRRPAQPGGQRPPRRHAAQRGHGDRRARRHRLPVGGQPAQGPRLRGQPGAAHWLNGREEVGQTFFFFFFFSRCSLNVTAARLNGAHYGSCSSSVTENAQ
ncbi:E3 ubiquitin-protein ligase MSL2a isoform X2 [Vanacampus margaritifer]